MVISRRAERLANSLLEMPRTETDIEAAAVMRELNKVYQVAYEMVYASTHEQSKAAYVAMIDLIKGNQIEDRQTQS